MNTDGLPHQASRYHRRAASATESDPYLESGLGHALCWLRGRLLRAAADDADDETDEADETDETDETVRAAADAADEPSEEQSEQLERLQAESPHAERRHERVERRHEHAERWFKEARTARLAAEEVLRTANEVLVAKLSEAAAGAGWLSHVGSRHWNPRLCKSPRHVETLTETLTLNKRCLVRFARVSCPWLRFRNKRKNLRIEVPKTAAGEV